MKSDGPGALDCSQQENVVAANKNQVSLQTRHKTQCCFTNKAFKDGTYYDPSFGESTHEASISNTPHGFRSTAPALIIAIAVGSVETNKMKKKQRILLL